MRSNIQNQKNWFQSSFLSSVLLLVFSLHSIHANGQNEARYWYFGSLAGLDFSTVPPTNISGSGMTTTEGCASISDAAGNLLFYTDGITVFNSANVMMANGNGLFGDGSSTQSAVIVRKPGSNSLYYIFTQDDQAGPNGHSYSIVDMSLAAGMGSVTVKNITVYTPSCEKITAVKHCNGVDVWILTHEYLSSNFRAYLLSASGLSSSPVISSTGFAPMNNNATIGQMKVSPQGTKIGLAIFNVSGPAPFEVYDFDPSTGGVSNAITLGTAASAYGCEFSPNGSKFYGALGGGSLQLYQWDLCAGTSSAIINSKFTFTTVTAVIGSMQLASDGKIYMARNGATLSVINNPNLAGLGANFSNTGLILSSGISQYGLPNFVNSYFKNSTANFSTTIQCLNGSFTSSLVVGQLNSGCSSSSNTISALVWDFGEPSSGTANVGTGQNASHLYASAGTYTVKLKVFYPCYVDSAIQVISLLNVAPQLNVTGQLSICKGDKRTYSCFGASTFTWSNGFVGTSVSLSPTATTVYSVTGTTSNSCSGSKVFTVTVNKCTEVESQLSATNLSVGPNPFDTELVVVSEQQEVLELKDARGVIILELRLEPGINRINTSALAVGVYALKIKGSNFPIKKMIKVH